MPAIQSKAVRMFRDSDPDRLRRELKAIAEILANCQLVQERLVGKEGDLVRLVGTSFVGHLGTIVRVKPNRWNLVAKISVLGASCEMKVDERMVERVL